MSESVAAVVPVKRLDRALMRLAGVLSAEERRELQLAMLEDVLGACRDCPRLDETVVVTSDATAQRQAELFGARVAPDHSPPRGIDAAVTLGIRTAVERGASAALVLFADLPLLRPEVLAAVLDAAPGRRVTVAVSRDGTGTNALLLRPPGVMSPALGPGSLSRHLVRAGELGATVHTADVPELTLDVDTPDDLAVFLRSPPPCSTARACARMRLVERLTSAGAR